MSLCIKNLKDNISIVKPDLSVNRNVESIIAQIKITILENSNKSIILDLQDINFLDCIKVGTIIGTYHFLDFSGKKIYIVVCDKEIKNVINNLSLNNIEVICSNNKIISENIA